MKENTVKLLFAVMLIIATAFCSENVNATIVNSFEDFFPTGGTKFIHSVGGYMDDLKWINPDTGMLDIVPTTGVWNIGFTRYIDGVGDIIVGHADNRVFPDEYTMGEYLVDVTYSDGTVVPYLSRGTHPDGLYVVWDQEGDGIGSFINGIWTLGFDDMLYDSSDILFGDGNGNHVLGGVEYLPLCPTNADVAVLPEMILVPEPLTLAFLGLGGLLIRKRKQIRL